MTDPLSAYSSADDEIILVLPSPVDDGKNPGASRSTAMSENTRFAGGAPMTGLRRRPSRCRAGPRVIVARGAEGLLCR